MPSEGLQFASERKEAAQAPVDSRLEQKEVDIEFDFFVVWMESRIEFSFYSLQRADARPKPFPEVLEDVQ